MRKNITQTHITKSFESSSHGEIVRGSRTFAYPICYSFPYYNHKPEFLQQGKIASDRKTFWITVYMIDVIFSNNYSIKDINPKNVI
jgi:hypothetical protein